MMNSLLIVFIFTGACVYAEFFFLMMYDGVHGTFVVIMCIGIIYALNFSSKTF